MDLLKKTIILTSSDIKFGGMGVLTIIKGENGIYGNFKTYNVKNCQNSILGIISNNDAIKQKVVINENNNFKLDDKFDINGKISCVLVDKNNEKVMPLIWFSSSNETNQFTIVNTIYKTSNNANFVKSKITESEKTRIDYSDNKLKDIESKLNNKLENFYDEENKNDFKSKIDNVDTDIYNIDIVNNDNRNDNYYYIKQKNKNVIENLDENENLSQDNCVSSFSEKKGLFEYSDEEIEDEIDKNLEGDKSFFELISEQVEELFAKYPAEKYLEELIDNSKWVKIDFENNGKYYVLGLIYENFVVKYVCYGVPGKFGSNPPKEIEDYNQWVPFDINNASGEGYWIMYQDALTGESINLKIS